METEAFRNPDYQSDEPGDFFSSPVPIPDSAVDAAPLRCLVFNESWVSVLTLALQRLTYSDAWDSTDSAALEAVTQQAGHLLTLLQTPCDEI